MRLRPPQGIHDVNKHAPVKVLQCVEDSELSLRWLYEAVRRPRSASGYSGRGNALVRLHRPVAPTKREIRRQADLN